MFIIIIIGFIGGKFYNLLFSMNKIFYFLTLLFFSSTVFSQDLGGVKVSIANFIRRVYTNQPFSGVKILQSDPEINYLISVVEMTYDPNKSENSQNQIATIKARASVSQYFNNSYVSAQTMVLSDTNFSAQSASTSPRVIEIIKETSSGYAMGLELLSKFRPPDSPQMVYIFFREIKK